MPPLLVNDSLSGSNESFALHHTPTSISSLVIFSLTFLLGLPGNGLVIWVIILKMQRTVNTIWFLHLAVADFVCCLSLPFTAVHLGLHYHWPFGWFFCKIIPTAILFNMFASVFLLTTISIDRCLVVLKPVWCQNHRTVRFASGICGGIWLLAFVMCCPAFFYREISVDELGNSKCVYNWYSEEHLEELDDLVFSNDLFSTHPTFMATGISQDSFTDGILDMDPKDQVLNMTVNSSKAPHSSILNTVSIHQDTLVTDRIHATSVFKFSQQQLNTAMTNILHSDVPSGSYSRNLSDSNNLMEMYYYGYLPESQPPSVLVSITIIRSIFGFLLPFGIMTTCYALIAHKMLKNQFTKTRGKVLLLILLVVATFFLCWVPYHIIGVLYLLATPGTEFFEELALWDHISTALAYANSCTNPLLYVFVGKNFREKARQTLQRILEGAFSEEVTCSTAYSQEKSKARLDKNTDVSVL